VVAATVSLAALEHPLSGWDYGLAHKSPGPPLIGVGLLVVPLVVLGIGLRRFWQAMSLELAAQRLARTRATHDVPGG
jgi:hypothetical protein